MKIDHFKAITLFTDGLAEAKRFYTEFLGCDPIHEDSESIVFCAGSVMVNLLHNEAVPELLEPAPMAADGIRAVYSIEVASVDDEAARCCDIGIDLLNGPMDRPWGIRTASVRDPSGHVWEMSQTL